MTDSGVYDPDDPLARALFAAGRDEAPSPRALEKTLGAVGAAALTLSVAELAQASATVVPHAASGTLAGKAGASVAWVAFAKWTAIGMAGGLGTVAAADGVRYWAAPTSEVRSAFPAAAEALGPAARKAELRALAVSSARPASSLEIADPEVSAGAVSVASARASGDALQAELAQVDRARAALASGRWGEAFSESQRYESDHPRGRLLQEALLIRMRAFEQMGDSADARAVARRLIRMSPSSPHAAQARALLEAAGEIP